MTLTTIFENYLGFLWSTFSFDMEMLSKPWMYYLLLIPAFAYIMFFMFKWTILLIPFYGPFLIVLRAIILLNHKEIDQTDLIRESFKQTSNDIKALWRSFDRPDNKIYRDNELLIGSCYASCLEILEKNEDLIIENLKNNAKR